MDHFERLVFAAHNPLEREHQKLLAVVGGLLARLRTAPVWDDFQREAKRP